MKGTQESIYSRLARQGDRVLGRAIENQRYLGIDNHAMIGCTALDEAHDPNSPNLLGEPAKCVRTKAWLVALTSNFPSTPLLQAWRMSRTRRRPVRDCLGQPSSRNNWRSMAIPCLDPSTRTALLTRAVVDSSTGGGLVHHMTLVGALRVAGDRPARR